MLYADKKEVRYTREVEAKEGQKQTPSPAQVDMSSSADSTGGLILEVQCRVPFRPRCMRWAGSQWQVWWFGLLASNGTFHDRGKRYVQYVYKSVHDHARNKYTQTCRHGIVKQCLENRRTNKSKRDAHPTVNPLSDSMSDSRIAVTRLSSC